MDRDEIKQLRIELFEVGVNTALRELEDAAALLIDEGAPVAAVIASLAHLTRHLEREHPECVEPGYADRCLQDLLNGGDGIVSPFVKERR